MTTSVNNEALTYKINKKIKAYGMKGRTDIPTDILSFIVDYQWL